MNRTTLPRFNLAVIALHWLTLVLIGLAYATSWLQEAFEHTPTEAALQRWHVMFGVTVLGLAALRIAARALTRTPAILPAPPPWQSTLARAMHLALYVLMVALPLTGWLTTNAGGDPVAWFGVPLPTLVGPGERLQDRLEDVHEALANAGYALIGLHAAAALFHHYVVRDNALRLMLPLVRAR
jgi:cytochrome b561